MQSRYLPSPTPHEPRSCARAGPGRPKAVHREMITQMLSKETAEANEEKSTQEFKFLDSVAITSVTDVQYAIFISILVYDFRFDGDTDSKRISKSFKKIRPCGYKMNSLVFRVDRSRF
ncbi:hypothetical protein EVAR_45321_1 [Eumeta japonica]|uniref:Uncharacterized protein n=1 Tax=Eumeta variegata TaxID=151549 RepID=A0A4C1XMF0_EUMVA|nr:hypothetical protein EVAR_45321_1 [Eumeta japonica]